MDVSNVTVIADSEEVKTEEKSASVRQTAKLKLEFSGGDWGKYQ